MRGWAFAISVLFCAIASAQTIAAGTVSGLRAAPHQANRAAAIHQAQFARGERQPKPRGKIEIFGLRRLRGAAIDAHRTQERRAWGTGSCQSGPGGFGAIPNYHRRREQGAQWRSYANAFADAHAVLRFDRRRDLVVDRQSGVGADFDGEGHSVVNVYLGRKRAGIGFPA